MTDANTYVAPEAIELRGMLLKWQLTGAAAGMMVGCGSRQIRRYTGGNSEMPYAVLFTLAAKCTGIMIEQGRWREQLQSTRGWRDHNI